MSAIVARQPGALSLSARRGQSVVGSGCGRLVRQTATTAAAPRCLSERAPRVTTSTALLTPHPPALLSALLPSRSPSFPLLLPVVLSSRFSNLVLCSPLRTNWKKIFFYFLFLALCPHRRLAPQPMAPHFYHAACQTVL